MSCVHKILMNPHKVIKTVRRGHVFEMGNCLYTTAYYTPIKLAYSTSMGFGAVHLKLTLGPVVRKPGIALSTG